MTRPADLINRLDRIAVAVEALAAQTRMPRAVTVRFGPLALRIEIGD